MNKTAIPLLGNILIAFELWTLMFSPWTAPHLNFWACMTASALILTLASFLWGGPWWKTLEIKKKGRFFVENVLLGIGIAIALWGVFWVGDKLSQWMFPSFARAQVDSIYGMKNGFSPCVLSMALLFIIGPAEEIFWRAYVQRKLADWMPATPHRCMRLTIDNRFWAMLAGVMIYTLVHLFSFNFMLIMSALVCGAVWGFLYWLCPNRLPAIIISHALWDAAVFIWFPIM